MAASATQTPVTSWSPQTSPGTYNYGTLTAGTSVSQTFTLANSGGSATSALTITLTGSAAFTKTADSCTGTSLGPRKSCTVTISYAPASAGQNDSGTLTATAHKAAATASLTLLGAAAKATPAISTSPGPAGPITASTFVTDTATLTGGFNPTGTIEFQLYSTNDCSGPVVDDETVPVSGDGTYTTPDGYMPMEVGTYYWGASYSGDASNNPVASGCGDESVTITPASPAISTTPSPGGLVGSTTVTDTATLTGGFNPFGSIEFELFGPSTTADCTSNALVYVQSAHVSAGIGQYTSNPFTPTTAGTYWWTISYSSGDPNNNSAATTCGAESVTISTASPAISQN
ncbi:MAG: choice-of-anchor D domain-containing protein, partial [Pseudonocardiaceae bacterium]